MAKYKLVDVQLYDEIVANVSSGDFAKAKELFGKLCEAEDVCDDQPDECETGDASMANVDRAVSEINNQIVELIGKLAIHPSTLAVERYPEHWAVGIGNRWVFGKTFLEALKRISGDRQRQIARFVGPKPTQSAQFADTWNVRHAKNFGFLLIPAGDEKDGSASSFYFIDSQKPDNLGIASISTEQIRAGRTGVVQYAADALRKRGSVGRHLMINADHLSYVQNLFPAHDMPYSLDENAVHVTGGIRFVVVNF